MLVSRGAAIGAGDGWGYVGIVAVCAGICGGARGWFKGECEGKSEGKSVEFGAWVVGGVTGAARSIFNRINRI